MTTAVHDQAPGNTPEESVRKATVADLGRLVVMATEAVQEQRHGRGGPLWARREARQEPADTLAAAIGDPGQLVVVGELDGEIVGYGVVRIERLPDGGLLAIVDDIYVEADGRGVGLGEAMMDAMVAWAEEHQCVGIDALALPGNRATKNFFETFGLTARAITVHRALGPAQD